MHLCSRRIRVAYSAGQGEARRLLPLKRWKLQYLTLITSTACSNEIRLFKWCLHGNVQEWMPVLCGLLSNALSIKISWIRLIQGCSVVYRPRTPYLLQRQIGEGHPISKH